MTFTAKIRTTLEDGFEAYGRGVAKNPWPIVMVCVLLNFAFGLCLLSKTLNNDITSLYLPRNTETEKQTDDILRHFPDTSNFRFIPYSSVQRPIFADVIVSLRNSRNVLSSGCSEDISSLVDYVKNISLEGRYQQILTYPNVCAKRDDKCVISGKDFIGMNTVKVTEPNTEFIGDVNIENGTIIYAKYLKLRFYLRQENNDRKSDSKNWLAVFLRAMKDFRSERLSMVYSHCYSFFEELDNDTYPDIPYFSFAFTIAMFYYHNLASGGDCVSKRMHISRMGILIAPFSVMGAWGYLSGCGQTFTNVVGVMPYFLLYHQVNNMMVAFSVLSTNLEQDAAEDRVGATLRYSMVPISMVTLGHVTAFAALISSKYLAMETFSIYTAITILFNYINHVTFFAACLAIHEKRIDANRHFCTCRTVTSPDHPENEARSDCFRCCCTGRKPRTRMQTEGKLERIPRILLSKYLLRLPAKIISFCLLVVLFGVSIWRLYCIKADVFQETSITKTSYFSAFNDIDAKYFQRDTTVTFAVLKPVKFTENNNIKNILHYLSNIADRTELNHDNATCWLIDYAKSPWISNATEEEFIKSLRENFLPGHPKYINDIHFGKNNLTIDAFRCYIQYSNGHALSSLIPIKDEVSKFDQADWLDGVGIEPFCPEFRYIDSYMSPLYDVLLFTGVHIGVLILSVLLIYFKFIVALQILVSYVTFAVCLFGFASLFSVSITPVTMILFILGECYGSEVIIHSFCSYMHSPHKDRSTKTYHVVSTTTPFLSNTTLAVFLGLMVLFVEKSYVFISVLKVLGVGSMAAYLYGTLFVPVWLSVFGCETVVLGHVKKEQASINLTEDSELDKVADEAVLALRNGQVDCANGDTQCDAEG